MLFRWALASAGVWLSLLPMISTYVYCKIRGVYVWPTHRHAQRASCSCRRWRTDPGSTPCPSTPPAGGTACAGRARSRPRRRSRRALADRSRTVPAAAGWRAAPADCWPRPPSSSATASPASSPSRRCSSSSTSSLDIPCSPLKPVRCLNVFKRNRLYYVMVLMELLVQLSTY